MRNFINNFPYYWDMYIKSLLILAIGAVFTFICDVVWLMYLSLICADIVHLVGKLSWGKFE